MAASLPDLNLADFSTRLAAVSPEVLPAAVYQQLWTHYQELRRWNPRLSLVGPGTADNVVERHYGEALQVLPLLGEARGQLLDLGSGGGFPGIVLAAARPELQVVLVEPRQRKWAFLTSATHRAGLPSPCLNARVDVPLSPAFVAEIQPANVQFLTVRALRLTCAQWQALTPLLKPDARLFLWWGETDPELSDGWTFHREFALTGSECRRIVEYRRCE